MPTIKSTEEETADNARSTIWSLGVATPAFCPGQGKAILVKTFGTSNRIRKNLAMVVNTFYERWTVIYCGSIDGFRRCQYVLISIHDLKHAMWIFYNPLNQE